MHVRVSIAFSLLAASFLAHAQVSQFDLLLDLDGNSSSGCEVNTPEGPFGGVESILTTFVEADGPGQASVIGVERRDCTNPASNEFGPAQAISSGGWLVGIGNGQAGFNVIETFMPISPASQFSNIRMALVATDELGNSSVLTSGSAGAPITLGGVPPLAVPFASAIALAILALALLLLGLFMVGRRGRLTLTAMVCLSAGSIAGAACVLDGQIFNWSLSDLLAETNASDPGNGVDIRALFGKRTDGASQLCFRIDAALVAGTMPTAVNDDYDTLAGETLNVPAPGILTNDSGLPAPTVSSFGGGDLGGSVSDHAAGNTVPIAPDGSVSVNADGSLIFTPATGLVGDFSFDYRIENPLGNGQASILLTINAAPAITSDDNLDCTVDESCSFTFTASGFPSPTFTLPGLPTGLVLDGNSGELSGTPGADTVGEYELTLTASNGIAPDATQTFTLTIEPSFDPTGVYTDRTEFLKWTAPGALEPVFDQLGGISTPLIFSNADFEISMTTSSGGTLFGEPGGIITPNTAADDIIITFTSGPVTAVGANFWSTDLSVNPTGETVTIELSDGTIETYASTGPTDFRGFITAAPITSITFNSPGVTGRWATIANVVVGSSL